MKKILLLLLLPLSVFAQRQPGGISFTPQWNYVGTGDTSHIQSFNTLNATWSKWYTAPQIDAKFANKLYGTLYNKTTFTSTSDFTGNGVTLSTSGNKLVVGAGSVNFVNSADLTSYGYTCLDKWEQILTFIAPTSSSTTYRFGIGMRSSNIASSLPLSFIASIDVSNTGTKGTLMLSYGANGTINNVSSNQLTYNPGDTLQIFVSRDLDKLTGRLVNLSSPQADVSATMAFDGPNLLSLPNTGRFAIFNSTSAAISVTGLKVFSKTYTNADLAVIGDSKTSGVGAFPYSLSTVALLTKRMNADNLGGGGDGMPDYINRLPELIALKPKMILLQGPGRNELATGSSLATIKANIASYIASVQAAGLTIYVTTGFYETAVDVSAINSWLLSTYPTITIDTYTATAGTTSSLSTDLTHPTNVGYAIAYRTEIEKGLFPVSRDISTAINNITGTPNQIVVSAPSAEPILSIASTYPGQSSITTVGALSAGSIPYSLLTGTSTITTQGNSFNGTSQLVQTTAAGKYPALDGSLITNLTTGAAAAGTLTGTTLASNVVSSSLTSFGSSPTLVTPALGTPSALVGTNITGTASGLTAGNVTTNANLTGPITSVGNATSIASQTGTGTKFVMDTNPTVTKITASVATDQSFGYSWLYGGVQNIVNAIVGIPATTTFINPTSASNLMLGTFFGPPSKIILGAYSAGSGNYESVLETSYVASGHPVLTLQSGGGLINTPSLTASQLIATDASKNLVNITALPNGTTATTQTAGDNSTKVASTAYVDAKFPTNVVGGTSAAKTTAYTFGTYTTGGSDASYYISLNILVTASAVHNFGATVTYTDESNTSRVLTLNFSQLTGAFITAITNATGTGAYEGVPVHIRAKAATGITVAIAGTFTSVTYNATQVLVQETAN